MKDAPPPSPAGWLEALRRRKLVQWALAYAAVAFALLQATDMVAQRFDWPAAVSRALIITAVAGFFVTIVLAWFHGERGAQKVSGLEVVVLALLIAIGGTLVWRLAPSARNRDAAPESSNPGASAAATATSPAGSPDATEPDAKSIAVLPFENLSDDKSNAYFVSGMQDLILTHLSRVRELKVVSRSSTQRYASRPENLKQVGRELGVATLLEGSVQRAGDQVLINLQLIDARRDAHLWAESYTRRLDDLFAVEKEIAETVANALHATLSPRVAAEIARKPTENLAAYDAYLKARYLYVQGYNSSQVEPFEQSFAQYRKALELDPAFALAHVGLAEACMTAYWLLGGSSPKLQAGQLAAEARAELAKARALDPDSIELGVATARAAYYLNVDFAAAESAYASVLAVQPRHAEALLYMAMAQRRLGKEEEAIASLGRAAEAMPGDSTIASELGEVNWLLRRGQTAANDFRHALQLDPDNHFARSRLAELQIGRGDTSDATLALLDRGGVFVHAARIALFRVRRESGPMKSEIDAVLSSPGGGTEVIAETLMLDLVQALAEAPDGRDRLAALDRQLVNIIDALPANHPNHDLARVAHAAIAAVAGRDADALAQLEQVLARDPLVRDAYDGPMILGNAALVYAMLGRADLALPALARLREFPTGSRTTTSGRLRLDPAWDRIRSDARFAEEIAKLEQVERTADR